MKLGASNGSQLHFHDLVSVSFLLLSLSPADAGASMQLLTFERERERKKSNHYTQQLIAPVIDH